MRGGVVGIVLGMMVSVVLQRELDARREWRRLHRYSMPFWDIKS